MKKLVALILSIVMVCCFSVAAFAAESPSATEKVTVIMRKATADNTVEKEDIEYTLDKGSVVNFEANSKYGVFSGWSIYKVDNTNAVSAVEGVDFEIVSGGITASKLSVKLNSTVIVCANYGNTVTDPLKASSVDGSPSAPQTSDATVVYAVLLMLAVAAFGFGVKKVYSK